MNWLVACSIVTSNTRRKVVVHRLIDQKLILTPDFAWTTFVRKRAKTSDTSRRVSSSLEKVAGFYLGIESYTSSLKRMSQNEITSNLKPTVSTYENLARSIEEGSNKGRSNVSPESDLKSKVRKVFTSPNKPKEQAPGTVLKHYPEPEIHPDEAISE